MNGFIVAIVILVGNCLISIEKSKWNCLDDCCFLEVYNKCTQTKILFPISVNILLHCILHVFDVETAIDRWGTNE